MVVSIVLGMAPGELGRPYNFHLKEQDILKLEERIRFRESLIFGNDEDVKEPLLQISRQGHKAVEIYGGWEGNCVAKAVVYALTLGMNVIVPKGFIFQSPSFFDNSQLLKAVRDISSISESPIYFNYLEDQTFFYFNASLTDTDLEKARNLLVQHGPEVFKIAFKLFTDRNALGSLEAQLKLIEERVSSGNEDGETLKAIRTEIKKMNAYISAYQGIRSAFDETYTRGHIEEIIARATGDESWLIPKSETKPFLLQ